MIQCLFAQCRQTDVDLVEMRDRLMARKEALLAQAENGGLPIAKPIVVNLAPV